MTRQLPMPDAWHDPSACIPFQGDDLTASVFKNYLDTLATAIRRCNYSVYGS